MTVAALKEPEKAQRKSIRFPARSFLAFALAPEAPLDDWLDSLDHWTKNSPSFFAGRPVVLDLNALRPQAGEVRGIVRALAERGIRIYAIEANGMETLERDLPPLLKGARPASIDELRPGETPRPAPARAAEKPGSLIVDTPVRSGQSVYHPGDVILLASAGSGSEIVAGGSIHVYGTLRGRAFAGASGNAAARIFCRRNEAELLAVDGFYKTADELEATRGQSIQMYLSNGAIEIAPLG